MKIIIHGQILWNYGLLVMVLRIILLLWACIPEDKRPQWRKSDVLLYNILRQSIDAKTLYNIGSYKTCYYLWNHVKKLYINDILRLYRVISSITNLKQPDMDLFSYDGQMSALKDELASILTKSTNVEASPS